MENQKQIQIGDILVCSWGYSMSLNTFYKVISKKGKATFNIVKLNNIILTGGGYAGTEKPDVDSHTNQFFTVRLKKGRTDAVKTEYGTAGIADPSREYHYNRMD
jgi:hypothetical protein